MVETTHAHRENPAHAAFEACRMQAGKKQAHAAQPQNLRARTEEAPCPPTPMTRHDAREERTDRLKNVARRRLADMRITRTRTSCRVQNRAGIPTANARATRDASRKRKAQTRASHATASRRMREPPNRPVPPPNKKKRGPKPASHDCFSRFPRTRSRRRHRRSRRGPSRPGRAWAWWARQPTRCSQTASCKPQPS